MSKTEYEDESLDRLLDALVVVEPKAAWEDAVMRARRSRRRYAFAAALIVALVVAPTAWAIQHYWTSSQLAENGITLSAPVTAVPANGQTAADTASHDFDNRKVISYEFKHCVDVQRVPPVNQDCWAVFLDPSHGAVSGGPRYYPSTTRSHASTQLTTQQATYFLVLVDPTTDTVIEGASGS